MAESTGHSGPKLHRRELGLVDLSGLAIALRREAEPSAIYRAVDELSAEVIGHRLFTIMRLCAGGSEVERVHTNMPAIYPIGGRKRKAYTLWADRVLGELKIYRAVDADGIRSAFDDHKTILGLGLASVLNVPVVFRGRCLGTMNLLHESGWYGQDDESTATLLASFLIPALLDGGHEIR
jgi:GAF domain-containing protein